MNIPADQLEICLNVLQQISEEPEIISEHDRFKSLIAKIYKEGRRSFRQTQQQQRRVEDKQLKASTVMVQYQHEQKSFAALPESTTNLHKLHKPICCYICKTPYTQIHFFYHLLCPKCAEFNYQKRQQRTNLAGRIALVTGGRIKIGYQMVLRLLRDGARVILTTRFPYDCAYRYSLEPDFEQWRDRLQIHGLDLRNIPALEIFVQDLLHTESALDIIINNAAQTIKRPLAFYQHLLNQEDEAAQILSEKVQGLILSDRNTSKENLAQQKSLLLESQASYIADYFPPDRFDADGQQLDLRPINSWLLKLDEVNTIELLEVQLVNAIAPFIINSKLKGLLMRSPFERRFIINVSAMEGQFNRDSKTPYHPHTNMAKAALNMMTRTSAADYAKDNIFMNSVDTGWITNENPYPQKMRIQVTQNFYTPLDAIDGMARIYDPIVQGIENPETPIYGHFLKDYAPYPW
ncbi:SDR family NAD(P)-dependent oxidoreductase [Microseira sp. BLCC-F43]|jgi:NAD(P)-dependent dehydrogenase (short-subunit alcohol dehydrogenase family)|uniref:SDR family NAD(P)-dependent oxidoreductase n=1 Tax=Microseira sp. BLCC-F43 TaxID=3153602 RepID=UPI0035BA57CB